MGMAMSGKLRLEREKEYGAPVSGIDNYHSLPVRARHRCGGWACPHKQQAATEVSLTQNGKDRAP